MKASKLIYMTDVDGLLLNDELQSFLELQAAEECLRSESVSGGMIPKLSGTIQAIKAGVESVQVYDASWSEWGSLDRFPKEGTHP